MRNLCLSTANVTRAKRSPLCEKDEEICKVSESKGWEMADVETFDGFDFFVIVYVHPLLRHFFRGKSVM